MPALSRPAHALAELRALLSLATPIIIAQLAGSGTAAVTRRN